MSVDLTWNVVQMDVRKQEGAEQDVVYQIHWTLDASTTVDGKPETSQIYGSVGVKYDPEAPFIPYDQITKDEAIAWVKEVMGQEQTAKTEATAIRYLNDKLNPPVVTPPLPWAV